MKFPAGYDVAGSDPRHSAGFPVPVGCLVSVDIGVNICAAVCCGDQSKLPSNNAALL
jgi:hypothetical protein